MFTLPQGSMPMERNSICWQIARSHVRNAVTYLVRYGTNSGYTHFAPGFVITGELLLGEALSSHEVILIPCSELIQWFVLCRNQPEEARSAASYFCGSSRLQQDSSCGQAEHRGAGRLCSWKGTCLSCHCTRVQGWATGGEQCGAVCEGLRQHRQQWPCSLPARGDGELCWESRSTGEFPKAEWDCGSHIGWLIYFLNRVTVLKGDSFLNFAKSGFDILVQPQFLYSAGIQGLICNNTEGLLWLLDINNVV